MKDNKLYNFFDIEEHPENAMMQPALKELVFFC